MDATTARPTLLSAAKNFIRKSAGTAVLAIAPLAAVSVAPEAEAQTIFGTPGLNQSFTGGAIITGSFPEPNRFSFQGGTTNSITAMRFGVDGTFTTAHVSGGNDTVNTLHLFTAVTNFDIPASTIIPFAYNFTLNQQSGSFNTPISWTLKAEFTGDTLSTIATGATSSGSQTFTGSGNYTTSLNISSDLSKDFNVFLELTYESNQFAVLAVNMNSASQGFTVNAIPEPSTYAAIFGLGALGYVIVRRSRRARAA